MLKTSKEMLTYRINLLKNSGKENNAIIKKLERKLRKLDK